MTTLLNLALDFDATQDLEARIAIAERMKQALGLDHEEFDKRYEQKVAAKTGSPAAAVICEMGLQSVEAEDPPEPDPPLDPAYDKFLRGLAKLSKRTGVVINGCGCCGSPGLQKMDDVSHYVVDAASNNLTPVSVADAAKETVVP